MTSKGAIFTSDPEFCPDCGTILPIPGLEDYVVCKKCGYNVEVSGNFELFPPPYRLTPPPPILRNVSKKIVEWL